MATLIPKSELSRSPSAGDESTSANSISRVRTAVVGAGAIAKQHIGALQAVGVQEIHACDLSSATAQATAERFQLAGWYNDYEKLLADTAPHIVHVTTPAKIHADLAREALLSGANVLVEKPITQHYRQWLALRKCAAEQGRWIIENQNYVFNWPVQRLRKWARDGQFGDITHVDVKCCLDVFGPSSPLSDANHSHPTLDIPGGVVADFLTHLASLVWTFVGPHQRVTTLWLREHHKPQRSEELRAIVLCENHRTAAISFSTRSQPNQFLLNVYGTRMKASVDLFEADLHVDRVCPGPRPLTPLVNGLIRARDAAVGAVRGVHAKLSGTPSGYEGLWELIRRTYQAYQAGNPPPISERQIDEVNQLVHEILHQGGCG